jgi:hypothetical protein
MHGRLSTSLLLIACGLVMLAATLMLAVSRTPLGSPLFFVAMGLIAAAYLLALRRVRSLAGTSHRWLLFALLCAVIVRVPLTVAPVGADNDMVRYLWDGRVQRLGYNPYLVVPADPAMTATHTDQTRLMPSRRARTPYPPGAQVFFRLVSTVHETTLGMKLALVGCDLLTIAVLWRWLVATRQNEWLVLVYAWHPLVILEISDSGHIDALATLWIVACAYWLARRRTLLASIAFVLAVATKLLPLVVAPLLWKRIRVRDAAAAAAALAALYLPFTYGTTLPLGAVPNVVAHIRFNSPVFSGIAATAGAQAAAGVALMLALAVAGWARLRLPATEPAAWAWPMAIALACAPVVYPWYLLALTPFLFSTVASPLILWTLSVLPVYIVWNLARHGGRWVVPVWVQVLEYGALAVSLVFSLRRVSSRSEATAELN